MPRMMAGPRRSGKDQPWPSTDRASRAGSRGPSSRSWCTTARSRPSSPSCPTCTGGWSASGSPARSSWTRRPTTACTSATTCSPATWRWTRSRATRSPAGRRATATCSARSTGPPCAARAGSSRSAIVVCDVFDERSGEPVAVAPRTILRRQLARARDLRLPRARRLGARVLRVPRELRERERQGLPGTHDLRRVRRGLPHPAGHQDRAAGRRDPPQPRGVGDSGRVQQGRVGAGPAGDQPALLRAARDGRPPRALQERGEGDRRGAGARDHVHGEVGRGDGRQQHARAHEPLGSGRRRPTLSPATSRFPAARMRASTTFRSGSAACSRTRARSRSSSRRR